MDRRSFLGRIGGLVAGVAGTLLGACRGERGEESPTTPAESPKEPVIPGCDKDTEDDGVDIGSEIHVAELPEEALRQLGDTGFVIYPNPEPMYAKWHYMAQPTVTTNTMPYGIDYWIENTA